MTMDRDRTAPERIGRYRIDGELGRGAMGVVYRGHDEDIDRPVALKTVRADLLDGPDADNWLTRFRQEARAAARCLHPNIVTVFEYGEDAGLAFIAMEYVRGRSLQAFLARDTPFGTQISVRVVSQVLSALGAAHALGVVHRDIKPSNVIILESGAVKVTDFGIARLADSVSLSQHGAMVGTPGYMAPEQFTGGTVDARTDLFAVGVVLYELLTGRKPFPGKSMHEVMYRVLNGAPEPPVGRTEPLSKELIAVMMTALARDPDDRYPDAAAFRRALKAAAPAGAVAPEGEDDPADAVDATRVMKLADAAPPAGPAGELDEAAVRQAREHLATHIGPVASVIVRDAVTRVSGVRQLYEVLAEHIPDDAERTAFQRKAVRGALGVTRGSGTQAGTGGSRPTGAGSGVRTGVRTGTSATGGSQAAPVNGAIVDEDKDRLRLALAEHLGPIAGVLVKREAARANSPAHLGQLLAEHIDDPDARNAFLKRVRG
ncbi:serine/threonine-protein kinase [uncultured Rhodospira sp.]|uniref:serine/threonine-protein kinase n=1 Tax=uncultured Rhodospira sp. TaxID=1936189 RepID=UPI00261AA051|nr:serine/threonine-protein kinase [uncultured Rhodospira sp.]